VSVRFVSPSAFHLPRIGRLALALLLLAGAGGAAGWPATGAVEAQEAPAACDPGRVMGAVSWQLLSGTLVGTVSLTNQSEMSCVLVGRPQVQLRDANGRALNTVSLAGMADNGFVRDSTVILPSLQTATMTLIWRNWCQVAPLQELTTAVSLPSFGDEPLALTAANPDGQSPRCDSTLASSTLSIGPFEPPAGLGISFANLVPAPGSTVPSGSRTIAASVASLAGISQLGLLLNTEPLGIGSSGRGAKQADISAKRSLAPGQYVVTLVAADAAGNRATARWQFQTQATLFPTDFSQLDARIEIVYPYNGAPVTEAERANVGVLLFMPGTLVPVPCGFASTVRLWRAQNSAPAEQVATGVRVLRYEGALTYPAWEFNDVDVGVARDPNNRLYFFVTVDGMGANSNVWVHGADPRTNFPRQDAPTAVGPWTPEVDARVEIVYPFDDAPVSRARLANVGSDVFQHGQMVSVDASRSPNVYLLRSVNTNVPVFAAAGEQLISTAGGLTFPRWVFNQVDVSEAAASVSPGNVVLFRTVVDGQTTFSNVWSHGADARTYFPVQDVPAESCR
jgi:hypothetical protein